jgi:hypothetical protein
VGGTVRGNYATWNAILQTLGGTASTYTNGNLVASSTSSNWVLGTIRINDAKYYFELVPDSAASGLYLGINSTTDVRIAAYSGGIEASPGGGSNQGSLASWSNGDVIGVAVDGPNKTVQFYRNGSTYGTLVTYTTALDLWAFARNGGVGSSQVTANFGQRAFAYTAPSGFKALCTQNLPTPTIGATTATLANKYFDATLYTGTGSTLAVTNTGGFQPDWVWLKNRSNVAYHSIWDAVRGRSAGGLASNDTMAEQASTAGNDFVSFNSNGFSVGPAQNWNVDTNGNTYVGWQWKANGAGVTNTAGSITSTVSASTTSGFSVVTYTGTGANATVGHGLGVAPSMILIKSRSSVTNWNSYHIAVGASATIILNTTSGAVSGSTFFNSTAPTSTVFSLGSDGSTNPSGAQQVAYCFAPIAGYSAFGSYTGNGSADGPFIYTGFKPAFVLIKRCDTTSGGYWRILDDTRNTSNVVDKELYPNDTSAEGTFAALDFTSNGVKMRNSDPQYNTNNALYLYACFAETPLKFSLAR